jgi:fatty-acyl-CoA synthase
MTKFDVDLDRNAANFRPMTPIQFLLRARDVFPDRLAVIHGQRRFSWAQHAERCHRLASALAKAGINRGDTVAALMPNTPAMLELHFGVPMAGAVLTNINTRLDGPAIAFILDHSEAKVLVVDRQLADLARSAITELGRGLMVIDVDDDLAESKGAPLGVEYEDFIAEGDADFAIVWPRDEWDAITLNYTSGTTGNPKGAVFHHRGTYLNALGEIFNFNMSGHPVFLWTLPLFHVNGWCLVWSMAVLAGTHVCLRKVEGDAVLDLTETHKVTHFCAAPTVLTMLIDAARARPPLSQRARVMTAGSAPPAPVLEAATRMGLDLVHVYGMTEMHSVTGLCEWQDEWDALPLEGRVAKMARQGVRSVVLDDQMVANPKTLEPVPFDGITMGEVMMRGNLGMKGYFRNPTGTADAFAGGWYHTGDLAVVHADGYIELKDRIKDIIISGGENISSIEVEEALYRHPDVACVAVVALADAKWGEVPCAFVELKPECAQPPSEDEMIAFARDNLARFKCPRKIVFGPLAKTATGKIQKFELRKRAEGLFAAQV